MPDPLWQTIEIDGQSCDLFSSQTSPSSRNLLLFLHGRNQERLADIPDFSRYLQDSNLTAICPQGGTSWWLDRVDPCFHSNLSAEKYLTTHVLNFIQLQLGIPDPRIAIMGFDMGGQAALRLAFRYPRQFPVTIALSPTIDFHLLYNSEPSLQSLFPTQEAARQHTAILHINPLNRPNHIYFSSNPSFPFWFDGAQRLHEKLTAVGVPHECNLAPRSIDTEISDFHSSLSLSETFLSSSLTLEKNPLP